MNKLPPLTDVPPNLRLWADMLSALGGAAEAAARDASCATFRAIDRRASGKALSNAAELASAEVAAHRTPMWDLLSAELDKALKKPGARARLARYLGLPRQRITDYTKNRRTPDAETTLRILHWLSAVHAGHDPSYIVPPTPSGLPSASSISPAAGTEPA